MERRCAQYRAVPICFFSKGGGTETLRALPPFTEVPPDDFADGRLPIHVRLIAAARADFAEASGAGGAVLMVRASVQAVGAGRQHT